MNLNEIEKKCFILALFIRDDAQRFLLGSGAYEFKDSQLHFSANTMKNDVVEVQGNDGYMLAGQVRRPTTQVFDGYIGDASVTKAEIEGYRRDFLAFFSKNHYFTVVYVFADGSAIQRRRGFIVDAPEVRELWQMYPEYHIGMNFEDVNYYRYGENAQGEETYGKSATVELSSSLFGGLEWEDGGLSPSSIEREGNPISFGGTESGKNIQTFQIKGNLTEIPDTNYTQVEWLGGTGTQYIDTGFKTNSTMKVVANLTIGSTSGNQIFGEGTAGQYVNLGLMNHSGYYRGRCRNGSGSNIDIASTVPCGNGVFHDFEVSQAGGFWIDGTKIGDFQSYTYISNNNLFLYAMNSGGNPVGGTICNGKIKRLKIYDNGTLVRDFVPAIRNSDSVAGMYDLVNDTFYTNAGTGTFTTGDEVPQPTPEFPETIQVVTGEQTVTVSDGGGNSQTYTINLGTNLFDGCLENGGVDTNGINQINGLRARSKFYIPVEAGEDYTIKVEDWDKTKGQYCVCSISFYTTNDYTTARTSYISWNDCGDSDGYTFAIPTGINYIRFLLAIRTSASSGDQNVVYTDFSGVKLYDSNNSYDYELCKVGNYQDYIYKSGSDWYIHKEVRHLTLPISNMNNGDQYPGWKNMDTFVSDIGTGKSGNLGLITSYITNVTLPNSITGARVGYNTVSPQTLIMLLKPNTTETQWKTEYPNLVLQLFYGILNLPTDEKITDNTLIGQLEAVLDADTYDGQTVIEATSTGVLPTLRAQVAVMVMEGGVIWDSDGAVWKEGGGGTTTVQVDSIENVYPVWTVTGPAHNPILENLTTGTVIRYAGNVTATQTLVIDMMNQTAKLNGTSVIGNVSGEWLEFVPGNNTVSYTADNNDAPDSTIEWQEVVG